MPNGSSVHRGDPERGKALSSFGHHAPNLLAIPRLASDIPTTIENDRFDSRWSRIALLWLDAGYIVESDKGSPREMIQIAVARWMEKLVEGNRLLGDFGILIFPHPSADGFQSSAYDEAKEEWRNHWFFGIMGGYTFPWVRLERRITELEQACPGLGKTAFYWFEMASVPLLPIFTPLIGRHIAERIWWCGMDNQEDYESEMRAYHALDNIESMEEDSNGPNAFDNAFPEWMFGPGKDAEWRLDAVQLQQIALEGETEDLRKISSITLALSQTKRGTYRLPSMFDPDGPVESTNAYHLAHVRWNGDDPLLRLADDYLEEANQCGDGFTELLGADCVPLDESGFQKWKTGIEAGFAVLKQLDALLSLISDPE